MRLRSIVGVALVVVLQASAVRAESPAFPKFESSYQAAVTALYGALLSSARGDTDGTTRHLVVLKSRWSNLARDAREGAPPWASELVTGRPVLEEVAASVEKADDAARRRRIADAHATLEGVRSLLREVRVRRGERGFDDVLSEYHEAIERLSSRVGLQNEMILSADDFDAIRDLTRRGSALWQEVQRVAGATARARGWVEAAGKTDHALAQMSKAVEAAAAGPAAVAAQELRDGYFGLLGVLAAR